MSSPKIKSVTAVGESDSNGATTPADISQESRTTAAERNKTEDSSIVSTGSINKTTGDEIVNESADNLKNNASFNPNLPESEENEILERLRGDAIGSTLYSERFVISTILKLREMENPLQDDEKFERDLENLWDMTTEKDVVLKLMELDVYEIFTHSIVKCEKDGRLIEILVGLIGNMCAMSESALKELCESEITITVLLQLISSEDSLVLIQLMRLLITVYVNSEAAQKWNRKLMTYTEFVENFCFLLNNSYNETLLSQALEALNAILATCTTMAPCRTEDSLPKTVEVNAALLKTIVNPNLVSSTIEAFQTFYGKESNQLTNHETDDFTDTEPLTESLKRFYKVFLNIYYIILDYELPDGNDKLDEFFDLHKCFNAILYTISTPSFVVPENTHYLLDVVENLLPIYMKNKPVHNEDTIFHLINLWHQLKQYDDVVRKSAEVQTTNFEEDDSEFNEDIKELYSMSTDMLTALFKKYKTKSMANILRRCEAETVLEVLNLFDVKISHYNQAHIEAYCEQLHAIFNPTS